MVKPHHKQPQIASQVIQLELELPPRPTVTVTTACGSEQSTVSSLNSYIQRVRRHWLCWFDQRGNMRIQVRESGR